MSHTDTHAAAPGRVPPRALIRAIEGGSTVLLENFDDDMDDITEQLLACRLHRDTRGKVLIRLGDTSIPYHPT